MSMLNLVFTGKAGISGEDRKVAITVIRITPLVCDKEIGDRDSCHIPAQSSNWFGTGKRV